MPTNASYGAHPSQPLKAASMPPGALPQFGPASYTRATFNRPEAIRRSAEPDARPMRPSGWPQKNQGHNNLSQPGSNLPRPANIPSTATRPSSIWPDAGPLGCKRSNSLIYRSMSASSRSDLQGSGSCTPNGLSQDRYRDPTSPRVTYAHLFDFAPQLHPLSCDPPMVTKTTRPSHPRPEAECKYMQSTSAWIDHYAVSMETPSVTTTYAEQPLCANPIQPHPRRSTSLRYTPDTIRDASTDRPVSRKNKHLTKQKPKVEDGVNGARSGKPTANQPTSQGHNGYTTQQHMPKSMAISNAQLQLNAAVSKTFTQPVSLARLVNAAATPLTEPHGSREATYSRPSDRVDRAGILCGRRGEHWAFPRSQYIPKTSSVRQPSPGKLPSCQSSFESLYGFQDDEQCTSRYHRMVQTCQADAAQLLSRSLPHPETLQGPSGPGRSQVPRRQVSLNELNLAQDNGDVPIGLPSSSSVNASLATTEQTVSASACTSPMDPYQASIPRITELLKSLQAQGGLGKTHRGHVTSPGQFLSHSGEEATATRTSSSRLPPPSSILPIHRPAGGNSTARQKAKELYSMVRGRMEGCTKERGQTTFLKASSVPNERPDTGTIQKPVRPMTLTQSNMKVRAPGRSRNPSTSSSHVAEEKQLYAGGDEVKQGDRNVRETEDSSMAGPAEVKLCDRNASSSKTALISEPYSSKNQATGTHRSRDKIPDGHRTTSPTSAEQPSDQTDQLLSSLSKFTLDASGKPNGWDDGSYCLSDVESEYAALGLLLPFHSSSRVTLAADEAIRSRGSPIKGLSDDGVVCHSDTETRDSYPLESATSNAFRAKSRRGSFGRLPVASVAPMMACAQPRTASKESLSSDTVYNSVEQNTVKKKPPATRTSHKERLKQNLVSDRPLVAADSEAMDSITQECDQAGAAVLNPLEGIKLPYPIPTALRVPTPPPPIRTSVSNYAIPVHSAVTLSQLSLGCELDPDSVNSDSIELRSEIGQIEQLQNKLVQADRNIATLIGQLQAKDAEIEQLRSTIAQLQNDMQRLKMTQESLGSKQRPPRAMSSRSGTDNLNQNDTQETVSVNSLTSGTSSGSQEQNLLQTRSEIRDGDQMDKQAKRSKWMKPTIGKAFKKRSRSSMDSASREHASTESLRASSPLTATVYANPYGSRTALTATSKDDLSTLTTSKKSSTCTSPTLDDPAQALLTKMRREIQTLEADNRRLRQLIMNSALTGDPLNGEESQSNGVVSLLGLTKTRYRDCMNTVHVLVKPSTLCDNSSDHVTPLRSRDNSTPSKLFPIGQLGVTENASWEEFDQQISKLIQNYLKFVDPAEILGLHDLTVASYYLTTDSTNESQALRRKRCKTPSEIGSEFVFDSIDLIISRPSVWIANNQTLTHSGRAVVYVIAQLGERSHPIDKNVTLGNLAFETLVPRSTLEAYETVIRSSWFTVLSGPPESEKSKILVGLAACLSDETKSDGHVISVSIKPNGVRTVDEVFALVCKASRNDHRQFMILDGLHNMVGSVHDLATKLRSIDASSRPIVLATSDIHTKELDKLQDERLIRLLNHLTDIDQTAQYLGCYLKRKLAHTYLGLDMDSLNVDDASTLTHVVTWLPQVWRHLSRFFSPDDIWQCSTIFGLRVFLTCPLDVAQSREWFTDLWDNLFRPFLFRTRSAGTPNSNQMTLTESIDWITATWPWPRTESIDGNAISSSELKDDGRVTRATERGTKSTKQPETPTSLKTFGVYPDSKQRPAENRSSMDSGIVPDGFPTAYSGTNVCGFFENRSSLGSDTCERLCTFDGSRNTA